MNYRVRIMVLAQAAMQDWQLPRALMVQVLTRLVQVLAANPGAYLTERIVPLAAFSYTFTLAEAGAIPERLHFLFAVERHEDVRELHVIGARLTREDKGDN